MDSNGNLGIGTTSPSSKLMIYDDTTGDVNFIKLYHATNYGATLGVNTSVTGDFFIQTVIGGTGTKRLTIQRADGNIGIGTTAPASKLEILSTAADADRTLPHNVLTITAEQGNAPYTGFGGAIVFKNRTYSAGMLTAARIKTSINYDGYSGQEYGTSISFDITPNTGSALTEAMRIKYDGNVGIGTTAPASKLEIYSGSGNNYIYTTNATSNTFKI